MELKDFLRIAEYGNAVWKGLFTKEEVEQNAKDYLAEYEYSNKHSKATQLNDPPKMVHRSTEENIMKRILRKYGMYGLMVAVTFLMISTNMVSARASGIIAAQNYNSRVTELMNQGYSLETAADQAHEEFYGTDGMFGNGGIDGITISGSSSAETNTAPTATPIPECSHTWEEKVTKEATCSAKGEKTTTCSKCGKSSKSEIFMIAHVYDVTASTYGNCMEVGTVTYTCKVCGESYTEETKAGDHVFIESEDSKEATCNEAGFVKEVCQYCGETKETASLPLGCEMSDKPVVTKEATCTADGEHTYNCTRCGEMVKTETVPAMGHTKEPYVDITKKATFFTDGMEQYICDRCGEVLEEKVIPATGGVWRIVAPVAVAVVIVAAVIAVVVKKRNSPVE